MIDRSVPSRRGRRPSPSRAALSLVLAVSLVTSACASSTRIYSTMPVDKEGQLLDTGRVDMILLENDVRRRIALDETLSIVGSAFVIEGPIREDGTRGSQSFAMSTVDGIRQRLGDGKENWIDVSTPDDLTDYETLPRIDSIVLHDGERIELGGELFARWTADRLGIFVGPVDDPERRQLAIDSIERVEVHDANVLKSTLGAPAFWVVVAVSAGLSIWLAGVQDEDSLATR